MWWIDRLPPKQRFSDSHAEILSLLKVELILLCDSTSPNNVTEVLVLLRGPMGEPGGAGSWDSLTGLTDRAVLAPR